MPKIHLVEKNEAALASYTAVACRKDDYGEFKGRPFQFIVKAATPLELLSAILRKFGYTPEDELDGFEIKTMQDVTDYLNGMNEQSGKVIVSLAGPAISYKNADYAARESAISARSH